MKKQIVSIILMVFLFTTYSFSDSDIITLENVIDPVKLADLTDMEGFADLIELEKLSGLEYPEEPEVPEPPVNLVTIEDPITLAIIGSNWLRPYSQDHQIQFSIEIYGNPIVDICQMTWFADRSGQDDIIAWIPIKDIGMLTITTVNPRFDPNDCLNLLSVNSNWNRPFAQDHQIQFSIEIYGNLVRDNCQMTIMADRSGSDDVTAWIPIKDIGMLTITTINPRFNQNDCVNLKIFEEL